MSRFRLFASCIPVKGHAKCIIQDVQLNRYKVIPNLLFEVLKETKYKNVEEIKQCFNNEIDEGIQNYFDLLADEGYGFYTKDGAKGNIFEDIVLNSETPAVIDNAHIDFYPDQSPDKLFQNLNYLNRLGCEHYAVFCHGETPKDKLENIFEQLKNAGAGYIEIYISYMDWMTKEVLIEVLRKYPAIVHFLVHSAPFDRKDQTALKMVTNLTFSQKKITLENNADYFEPVFVNNLRFFAEAQSKNVHFNKKIYLNNNGLIKNAFNTKYAVDTKEISGFDEFREVFNKKKITACWHVPKDEIFACRACEFRYMCLDDRLPQNDEDKSEWYYESECIYNPFIGKFREDEGYVPVKEALKSGLV